MTLSSEDQLHHEQCMRAGNWLARGEVTFAETHSAPLTNLGRLKLNTAAYLYRRALNIRPGDWAIMWCLGKVFQRLGDHDAAFSWLQRSQNLNPGNPEIAREACNEALRLGKGDIAVELGKAAVKMAPSDPGILCNLAMAYLIAGDRVNAMTSIEEAATRMPSDPVTAAAAQCIIEVAFGKREQPKSIIDFEFVPTVEPGAPSLALK